MIIAESVSGIKVNAKQAERQGQYFCSLCKEQVILKRGQIKVPHFSHRQDSDCSVHSEGETWEHMKGKCDLYDWLELIGLEPEMEVYIDSISQRADVLFKWMNQLYAIEYQCSPVSENEVITRTQGYQSVSIKPLWIAGNKLSLKDKLSVLNRLFIMEEEQFGRLHLSYNAEIEQLEVSCMGEPVLSSSKRCRYCLNKYATSFNEIKERKARSFRAAGDCDKKKQIMLLHKMRHHNVRQYRSLFQLMYEHNLVIDRLPTIIFSEISEEWAISTHPIEWKLQMIIWLKEYSDGSVITQDRIEREFYYLIGKKFINRYFLPNLKDNSHTILLHFIALLENQKYLNQVEEKAWEINKCKYNW
ncbi:MAG: hypothetical protein JJU01_00730 [Alkalibacterium sp.]|nr:hypothetical protein [Alkalibacterium sp.]